MNQNFHSGPFDRGTIERSTRYFIRPKCSIIDPAQETEIRRALIATRESLFKKVDYFLDYDESQRHLLLLADSGMGKTSFLLNYFVYNKRKKSKFMHDITMVPLGIDDADAIISSIENQENKVIFLDAFDEDIKAIDNHYLRLRELMKLCKKFKRMIITCRTQFFPKEEEIPIETGIARIGPRKAGESGTYEFWKLYLCPFDDDDIKGYLQKKYPFWRFEERRRAFDTIRKIPLLSVRPMLLAHVPDIVSSNINIKYCFQLYDIMVKAWIVRESAWVDKDHLLRFSKQLAVDIFINREARGAERVPYEELIELAERWGISLQNWQISGRSLLNRDAKGNYKFAHRSIMEHLFVENMLGGDDKCFGITLTDQMKYFLFERFKLDSHNSSEITLQFLNNNNIGFNDFNIIGYVFTNTY